MSDYQTDLNANGMPGYAACIEAAEYNLMRTLKTRVSIDGNQWCVLFGENLQDGVAGFGDTPYAAVLDFNKAWNLPLARAALAQSHLHKEETNEL